MSMEKCVGNEGNYDDRYVKFCRLQAYWCSCVDDVWRADRLKCDSKRIKDKDASLKNAGYKCNMILLNYLLCR